MYKDDLLAPPVGSYLNTAAESPILRCVAEALMRYTLDKAMGEPGRVAFDETVRKAKAQVARLLSGDPSCVAFTYTTSDALGLLAQSIPWQAGDRVVVSDIEYPSDMLVWSKLAKTRVEIDLVTKDPADWGTEALLEKVGSTTKLVLTSAVSFRTGARVDLPRIKEAVNQHGGLLLADATQALGAVPVSSTDADIIVASGFKWMMGVHGLGVIYCNPDVIPQLETPYAGSSSVESVQGVTPTSFRIRSDAGRLEMGMPGFPAIYGLEAGLSYLQETVGIERVWRQVREHASGLISEFDSAQLPLITPRDPEQRAGIVCLRHSRGKEIVARLKENGVYTHAPVADVVRLSPHFFNTPEDVAHGAAAVRDAWRQLG